MIVAERLKRRMAEKKVSQAELARRVNLQQSTINDLVHGKSQSSRKIREIARELRTTPEFLEGLSDDPDADISSLPYSPEELELLDILAKLSPRDREMVREFAERLAGKGGTTLHDRRTEFRGSSD